MANLFVSAFTASEGEEAGGLIGNLVSELSEEIDDEEIIGFGAYSEKSIVGSIFFTRLRFAEAIRIYMLAPAAVSTTHQGRGIGQALINYGLAEMKKRSVAAVITYGDPSFYSKVGFHPLSERIIQAPLALSMPQGWLGQSLSLQSIPIIKDRPTCVKQFNDPAYW